MALSRPVYTLVGTYFEQLFNHPIRTKSITSCVVAASANYASQKISGSKTISRESVFAYGLFGLIFGGTVPHYFYTLTEKLFEDGKFKKYYIFLLERLMYAPLYQAISLFFLSIFEGKSANQAVAGLMKLYQPMLLANWKYLSLLVFLNVAFVPPMLRVLFANLIGFVWVMFLANKRRKMAEAMKKKATEGSESK